MEEDLPPELAARVQEMQDDETIDFDSSKRKADGWLKEYVECPECEVPMARSVVESEDLDIHTGRSFTRSEHRAVCPDCGKVAALLRVDKLVASFDQISRAFEPDASIYEGMLRQIEEHCEDQGWEHVAIEIEELRNKITKLEASDTMYDCEDCKYVGPMSQPMQTMDMPMKTECPACGKVGDHGVVEDDT